MPQETMKSSDFIKNGLQLRGRNSLVLPPMQPRHKPGEMNKTEAEYAALLDIRKRAGEVMDYWFEKVTLKIASDTRYTPDFFVRLVDYSFEFHEVKGFFRDDAKVKVNVASEMFPFKFYVARKLTKKQGGGWDIKEI